MRKNLSIYLITSCLTLSPLTAAAADLASNFSATSQQASKMEVFAEQLSDSAHDLKKLCKAVQRSAPTITSVDTTLQQASKMEVFARRLADGAHDLQKVWNAVQPHAASTLISAPEAADTNPSFEITMRSYFEKTEQHTELTQQKVALEATIASLSEKLGVFETDQLSLSEAFNSEAAQPVDLAVSNVEYARLSAKIRDITESLEEKHEHLRDIDERLSVVKLELSEYRELAEAWNSKLLIDQLKKWLKAI
jgi:chromosome segregation ATPase